MRGRVYECTAFLIAFRLYNVVRVSSRTALEGVAIGHAVATHTHTYTHTHTQVS